MNFSNLFQPATSKKAYWNLTKTYLQTAIFWLLFLFFIPQGIKAVESIWSIPSFQPQPWGWLLFVFCSAFGLYSGYTMSWFGKGTPLPTDCANQLVINGPYRWVRNPMAVAGIGQGVCVGLIMGSYLIIIYALTGAVLWHVFVRPIEEAELLERFGAAYQHYLKTTKCWIPKF